MERSSSAPVRTGRGARPRALRPVSLELYGRGGWDWYKAGVWLAAIAAAVSVWAGAILLALRLAG